MALPRDDSRGSIQSSNPRTEWDAVTERASAKLAGRVPLAAHPLVAPKEDES